MKHKPLAQVLAEAKEAFVKNLQEKPHLYKPENESAYILGWLGNSYERMYQDLPELLEVLVSLYTKFKGEGLGQDKWYGPIMEQAKKVIAKAQGGGQ